jgi:hypothetical protein
MKVIFRFVNDPGFGDNIRGLITILQIQKILRFELEVDFSHHVFSKFFINTSSNVESDYKQYIYCDENVRNNFLMVEIMNEIEIKDRKSVV